MKKTYKKLIVALVFTFALSNFSKAQYCISGLGGTGCTPTAGYVTNVSIATSLFNNTSACNTISGDTYSSFTPGAATTTTLTAGGSYSISVTTNANNIISVWIDYDQSGTFDALEHTQVCLASVAGIANTAVIAIPATALTGQTGLRVRSRLTLFANGPNDACSNFVSGEAEDYTITILGCTGALVYASVPFVENFDNTWQDRCDTRNVPVAANWDSSPTTGNESWRRQDDGASAGWSNPTYNTVSPAYGAGCANFHSADTYGNLGELNLYVNLSGTSGYDLSFYHVNLDGIDLLQVQFSSDGGSTFTPLDTYVSGDYTKYN